jgi:hypothetical protein
MIRRFCSLQLSQSPAAGCGNFLQRRCASACPFETLGVDRKSASLSDVKEAYRDLCKVHHPDVGGSEEKFKSIQGAYEQCKERIESGFVENPADFEHGPTSKSSEDDAGEQNEKDEDDRRYEEFRSARSESEARKVEMQRQAFRERFQHIRDADEIDALLLKALESDAFARFDDGEPLALALDRYHHCVPLGEEHVNRCFQGMTLWENFLRKRCSCVFYHVLLTHYTTEAFLHHCDAMTVTQSVERVMERMTAQGLPHDDWTISIANRAFRQLPFPDW